MNKLLVICGPTGVGKTSLALCLAKKFGGEIVSADSRQVYKGMDIATGKDLPISSKFKVQSSKLQPGYYLFEGIPVWMLDVVRPNQEFSVAQYVDLAGRVINDIWQRNKLPIVVGGTGFYIKGLIDGIETLGVPPDWELRGKLSNLEIKKLREMLQKLNSKRWEAMNESDRNNPRRLIRAIEITQYGSRDTSEVKKARSVLFIGLTAPYRELYQRIDKRIDEQVKMGAEKEVRKLLSQGYAWDLPAMTAMGYGVWQPYFAGKVSLSEVIRKWQFEEHGYARRQMTWFRKALRQIRQAHCEQAQGVWFDITKQGWENRVEKNISSWYTEKQDAKKG